MTGTQDYQRWLREHRPCYEIYGGVCQTLIGPPRWEHRINKSRQDEHKHPTPAQALAAARDPETLADVLRRLGDWSLTSYPEIVAAARANPNYPSQAA